jgi:steroid 5-alpha reductase family enzyme
MTFFQIYWQAFVLIIAMMTCLWIVSVVLKNASIVDPFWGLGFVLTGGFYFMTAGGLDIRKSIMMMLVTLWGLRLSVYLTWRNRGKGEDFRYREFRRKYGAHRYWWISFFQVFLLQGILMWLISAPLLGAQSHGSDRPLGILDWSGIAVWMIGFLFEAGGDVQLAQFRAKPENKGKVLERGFWRFTRHPNYFGDSAVWWGYGLLCLAAGSYLPVLGSIVMTALIIRVSGVVMLEKTLRETKPQYKKYIERTSVFFPWFPRKKSS